MSSSAPALLPNRRGLPVAAAFACAVASAAVVSVLLSAAVAAIAHNSGASHSFKALDVGTFAPLIVIGLLAGAAAWVIVRRRAADPARLLAWLAPAVVVVSLVPDVLVGATHSLTGATWGGVIALMVMHLIVAVCGVAALRHFLPLTARSGTGGQA